MVEQTRWLKLVAASCVAVAVVGAKVVALGRIDGHHHVLRADPDGDADHDGVLNALDNCLIVSNGDQRDGDHDGIGNVCDPDFNNDGVVGHRDLAALVRALGTTDRVKDLNGNGVVDRNDLFILLRLFGRPPGPRLDTDHDGVADLDDPCPTKSVGAETRVRGCTSLQVVQQPESVVGPAIVKATRLATALGGAPDLRDVRAELQSAVDDVFRAQIAVSQGDVCGSSAPFAIADERLLRARGEIERQLAEARAAFRASATRVSFGAAASVDRVNDVSEANFLVMGLTYWRSQLASPQTMIRSAAHVFEGVCATAGAGTIHGIVDRILDARRQIVLTDGRTFGLAQPINLIGDVFATRRVMVTGLIFADGNGLATQVNPDGPAADLPSASLVACEHLRFVPVQRLPPLSSGPFVLHDPRGYKSGNDYIVEAGMAVAGVSSCSMPSGGRRFPRYSMQIEISYQQSHTGLPIDHSLMAAELEAGDSPVGFPLDADPLLPATLHVTSEVRTCTGGFLGQCGEASVISKTNYPMYVRARGAMAFATYEQTEFDVNDQMSGDFRFAHLSFFTSIHGADEGTTLTFVAEGFGPFFDGITEMPIIDTDPFAIRNLDYYPVFPGVTQAELNAEMLAGQLSGVTHAAGLRWPRVQGRRNGHDYWYSATLPVITRDVVNLCPDDPHAYYRLPFADNDFSWTQGQGNHPEAGKDSGFTHAGGYAYDMVAPLQTPILAARAGRVVKIEESLTAQCAPAQCNPNNIFVMHQDGSIGEYAHMPIEQRDS